MKMPRWLYYFAGVICIVFLAPTALVLIYGALLWWSERPQSFEAKKQFRGAAIWAIGTQSQDAFGEGCTLKYEIFFARTLQPRERVDANDNFTFTPCFAVEPLDRLTWGGFGNGVYLQIGDTLHIRNSRGQWQKQLAFDGTNSWSLERINWKTGRVLYSRREKKRKLRRVFQMPQNADSPLILIKKSQDSKPPAS